MAKEIRVNRLILSDLPELYNFKSFEGNDAFGIFSSGEVISAVAREADSLGIDCSACEGTDLPKLLSRALESEDSRIKCAAEALAADLGRRLGLIFYVLKRDPAVTVRANHWYAEHDFDVWGRMRKVYLVGGLANGNLGKVLARYAEDLLLELGIADLTVAVGAFPSHAQLIGAARLGEVAGNALVFDFGHTFVKSAVAFFEEDKLTKLTLRPKVHSEYMGKGFASEDDERREAESLHEYIVKVISLAFSQTEGDFSSHVSVSIANNVIDGRIGRGGCYYKLMLLGENYAEYLSSSLSEVLGREICVTLVHDGKAAALCFEEEADTAALALGTAFGVGYTEGRCDLASVSEDLKVIE